MGNKGIQKIKENKVEVLSLALCIGFYMLFCFGFGVQLCADSNSYINMTSAREPVYPLLLAFFRLVCGETYYLWGVIIFQNMLMAFAVWKLTMWFRKHFSLPPWMVFICLAFHFGVALLCQFAAGRASIYPNSILTEGITLALWLIFINLLLEALFSGKVKYVALALVLAAVMMDTRKQMAVTYIVLFFTLVLGWIKRNGYWKKIGLDIPKFWKNLLPIFMVAAIVCGITLLISNWISFYNWRNLFAGIACYSVIYLIALWFFILNENEKNTIMRFFKRT